MTEFNLGHAHHLVSTNFIARYPEQLRLRNDLYCVGWGVKLYSLTHSPWAVATTASGTNVQRDSTNICRRNVAMNYNRCQSNGAYATFRKATKRAQSST